MLDADYQVLQGPAKLRQVFDAIAEVRGIYFFDEFDAIGSQRGLANDVGEIRRVLNSFLQMIEHDQSNSLIIAATNHPEILDYALFRRFDDVIEYHLPTPLAVSDRLRRATPPSPPPPSFFPRPDRRGHKASACAEERRVEFAEIPALRVH